MRLAAAGPIELCNGSASVDIFDIFFYQYSIVAPQNGVLWINKSSPLSVERCWMNIDLDEEHHHFLVAKR